MSLRRTFGSLFDRAAARAIEALIDRTQERLLHPHTLLLAEAQREAADYARNRMGSALAVRRREEVIRIAFTRAPAHGMILEFGVAGGESIRQMASLAGSRTVHGFDSFRGLPEDWAGRHEERGHYSTDGMLPHVPANVQLHSGLFAETLPDFVRDNAEPAAFVHIDCDLYTSTATVLEFLAPRITPGTVILFDEYFNFVGWQNHEFKAFQEFVSTRDVRYRYLCWGYQQVAVIVDSIGQSDVRSSPARQTPSR